MKLTHKIGLALCLLGTLAGRIQAEDVFSADRQRWLDIAEQCKPSLKETIHHPQEIVIPVQSEKAYQGWTYFPDTTHVETFYHQNFKEVKEVTLDFGEHLTGYCSLHIHLLNRTWDAPIRLKLTFGEMPAEMNAPLDSCPPNTLSRGWLQDETIEILEDEMDTVTTLRRRLSMRYLKIELLGASAGFDFAIDDVSFRAVSSAGDVQTALLPGCPDEIKDIDRVGIATLRECMQTVYEDGPKRDHRLWIGDLYLENLGNRYSFRDFSLTKRCLYLFAGLSMEDGRLICDIYEKPKPHPSTNYLLPYNLIYISALLDYYRDTKDSETARDLWKVAKRQIEDALSAVDENWLYDMNRKPSWYFFDWRDGLDVTACMQACVIDALQATYELATELGYTEQVKDYPTMARKMKAAARRAMWDSQTRMFFSGPSRQLSVLSQAWMIRAGVLKEKEGQDALRNALSEPTVVMPGTPYATHYLVDAMLKCGMNQEAHDYLVDYWGGMVKKGADTYFEAYDPKNDFISPYNFYPMNSYCHAWSCTPMYFIHRYPEIFQK